MSQRIVVILHPRRSPRKKNQKYTLRMMIMRFPMCLVKFARDVVPHVVVGRVAF